MLSRLSKTYFRLPWLFRLPDRRGMAKERPCVELNDRPFHKALIALRREAHNSRGRRGQLAIQACADQQIVATLTICSSSKNALCGMGFYSKGISTSA